MPVSRLLIRTCGHRVPESHCCELLGPDLQLVNLGELDTGGLGSPQKTHRGALAKTSVSSRPRAPLEACVLSVSCRLWTRPQRLPWVLRALGTGRARCISPSEGPKRRPYGVRVQTHGAHASIGGTDSVPGRQAPAKGDEVPCPPCSQENLWHMDVVPQRGASFG